MVKPYIDEKLTSNSWIRSFSSETDKSEFVWHRDIEDREITVVSGNGWKFQRDNELPFDLIEGKVFTINKMEYHRLIKGDDNLILQIVEMK